MQTPRKIKTQSLSQKYQESQATPRFLPTRVSDPKMLLPKAVLCTSAAHFRPLQSDTQPEIQAL